MNEPHLDEEDLSASLDVDADSAASAHLDRCAVCRRRRDTLDAVRRAVASAPPPPRAEAAERAVTAALEAWSAGRSTGAVTPLARAPLWRRAPGWALGAAAAVAALLVAVPIVTSGGGGGDAGQTASAPADRSAAGARADTEAAPVDGGDLGEQSDELALGQLLHGAVAPPPAPAGNQSARPAPAAGRELATPADDGARAPGPPAAASRRCAEVVRSTFGTGLGPLVYTASLRWKGAPAVLLAYRLADPSAPGPDHRAFVMAEDGCRLLVVQGF